MHVIVRARGVYKQLGKVSWPLAVVEDEETTKVLYYDRGMD